MIVELLMCLWLIRWLQYRTYLSHASLGFYLHAEADFGIEQETPNHQIVDCVVSRQMSRGC